MNKPPAFMLYTDDFIGGTVDMTTQEVGAYVRLLLYQWGKNCIPSERKLCDRIAGCKVTDLVLSKFPNGKNMRLEAEREKQMIWREKSRQGGLRSAANRGSTTVQPPLVPPGQPKGNIPASTFPFPPSSVPKGTDATHPPDAHIPTLEEVKTKASTIGVTPESAKKFFDHYEGGRLWINRNGILINWEHKLKVWGEQDRTNPPKQPQQPPVKAFKDRTAYDAL